MKRKLFALILAALSCISVSCKNSIWNDIEKDGKLTQKVREKIEKGKYDLNEPDADGYTYFTKYIKDLSFSDIKYLIEHGMDFDKKDNNGNHPIFAYLESCYSLDEWEALYIFEHVKDVNVKDKNGNSLAFNPKVYMFNCFYYLVQRGLDLTAKSADGKSVEDFWIEHSYKKYFEDFFIESNGRLDYGDEQNKKIVNFLKKEEPKLADAFSKMFRDMKILREGGGDRTRPQKRRPADKEKDVGLNMMLVKYDLIDVYFNEEEERKTTECPSYAMYDIKLDDGTIIPSGECVTLNKVVPDVLIVEDGYVCHEYEATTKDGRKIHITDRYLSYQEAAYYAGEEERMVLCSVTTPWVNLEDVRHYMFFSGDGEVDLFDVVLLIDGKCYDAFIDRRDSSCKDRLELNGQFKEVAFFIFHENDVGYYCRLYALDNLTFTYLGEIAHGRLTQSLSEKMYKDSQGYYECIEDQSSKMFETPVERKYPYEYRVLKRRDYTPAWDDGC